LNSLGEQIGRLWRGFVLMGWDILILMILVLRKGMLVFMVVMDVADLRRLND
jgi:hypothetical protein